MWKNRVKHPIVEAGPAGPLTDAERQRFDKLCAIVDGGMGSWIEVGKALYELGPGGGQRLYRETHTTFAVFVQDRWGLGKSRAYQLIDAAYRGERVQKLLGCSNSSEVSTTSDNPLGGRIRAEDIPARVKAINERHVRAMKNVPREQEAQVVARAVSLGGELTAAKIAKAVKEIAGNGDGGNQRKDYKARMRKVLHKLAAIQRELDGISKHGGLRVLGREWEPHLKSVYTQIDQAVKLP